MVSIAQGFRKVLFVLSLGGIVTITSTQFATAEIYKIIEKNGVVRFTSKPPTEPVQYEVFSAKGGSYARYSVSSRYPAAVARAIRTKYAPVIAQVSRAYGLDPALVKAVIHAESAFNPKAVSPKGAMGLMQLMPATAREQGVSSAFDPIDNIRGGVRYLAGLLKRYEGNVKLSLAAYNAGEGNVAQYGGIPPFTETRNYVAKVMQLHTEYRTQIH